MKSLYLKFILFFIDGTIVYQSAKIRDRLSRGYGEYGNDYCIYKFYRWIKKNDNVYWKIEYERYEQSGIRLISGKPNRMSKIIIHPIKFCESIPKRDYFKRCLAGTI